MNKTPKVEIVQISNTDSFYVRLQQVLGRQHENWLKIKQMSTSEYDQIIEENHTMMMHILNEAWNYFINTGDIKRSILHHFEENGPIAGLAFNNSRGFYIKPVNETCYTLLLLIYHEHIDRSTNDFVALVGMKDVICGGWLR